MHETCLYYCLDMKIMNSLIEITILKILTYCLLYIINRLYQLLLHKHQANDSHPKSLQSHVYPHGSVVSLKLRPITSCRSTNLVDAFIIEVSWEEKHQQPKNPDAQCIVYLPKFG